MLGPRRRRNAVTPRSAGGINWKYLIPTAGAWAGKLLSGGAKKAAYSAIGSGVGRGAKRAYRAARKAFTRKPYSVKSSGGLSTGTYAGKFSRPKKTKKSYRAICGQKGINFTREYYETVTASHTKYIKHSTYDFGVIRYCIFAAALRKLFEKAGIDVRSMKLPPNLANDGGGGEASQFRLRCQYYGPVDGGVAWDSYDIPAAATFDDIVNGSTLIISRISNFLLGSTANYPTVYQLQMVDGGAVPTKWITLSSIDLTSTKWTMEVISTLKVQNRSQGDTAPAADLSLDRVDNVPLYGKIFNFSNVDPRIRTSTSAGTGLANGQRWFDQQDATGVAHFSPSTLYPDLEEPPTRNFWSNCSGENKIVLQPGQMKSTQIKYVYTGTFFNFLTKLAGESGIYEGDTRVKKVIGRCQMLVLEEMLRTGSDNLLTLQVERQVEVHCMFTNVKKNYVVAKLDSASAI